MLHGAHIQQHGTGQETRCACVRVCACACVHVCMCGASTAVTWILPNVLKDVVTREGGGGCVWCAYVYLIVPT